jgi:NADH-quinone oxidoreductase subunit D
MMKVGGVRRDFDDSKIPKVRKLLDDVWEKAVMLAGAVTDDPVLHTRLKGVGILSPEDVHNYGALGPTARASGVAIDVRRDDPYAAYDRVDWSVITQDGCDVFARAVVRVLEIFESIKIIRQCLEKMPQGPIDANVKEIPPGEGIGHVEAPRGETFHYVRSDGTNRPVRHKVRAPTYMNLPTFKSTVIGQSITDATIILASVDPCYSCTERMGVYDASNGRRTLDGNELLRLSQEKTQRLRREMGK